MTNLTTGDQGATHKLKPRSFNKSFSTPTSLTIRRSLLSIIAKYIPLRHCTLLRNGVWFLIITYISLLQNSVLDMKPKKLSTSFTFVGVFHSLIALTFSSSICTSLFPTYTPSISISVALKLHFDCLKHKLCFSAILRNLIVHSSSFFSVFARITKSSM